MAHSAGEFERMSTHRLQLVEGLLLHGTWPSGGVTLVQLLQSLVTRHLQQLHCSDSADKDD